MRKYPSLGGTLVMTLKAGIKLTALEPVDKVKGKVGKANQWIYVREPNGKRGYVAAQYVQLAKRVAPKVTTFSDEDLKARIE